MKRQPIRLFAPGVLVLALFWAWYSIAANYDYAALAGTYRFYGNEETCVLRLHTMAPFRKMPLDQVKPARHKGIGIATVRRMFRFPASFKRYPESN